MKVWVVLALLVLGATFSARPALADHEGNVVADCTDVLAFVTKVNSLSPYCAPPDVVTIDAGLVADGYEPQFMRAQAASALASLVADAHALGLALQAFSGYRSYDLQVIVFWNYVDQYGLEEANRFSARPGHSEHQLGTTMDISLVGIGLEEEFGMTPAGQWLASNAVNYGFVISYPQGGEPITGYVWEPWHIRWLGYNTASAVVESGLSLTEWLGAARPLFEGWNPVTWDASGVFGTGSVVASANASVHGTGWVSVAAHRGSGWLQTFANAPLPAFNTLPDIAPGEAVWLSASGEGLFDARAR
jgi:D-alanyl-D-alanine carboxypeptidase